jgi:PAS domain S-box-containing protein
VDISYQKREKLSDPKLLADIIDRLPIAIFIKDHTSRYVLSNHAHSQQVEIPENKLIGQTIAHILGEKDGLASVSRDKPFLEAGKESLARKDYVFPDGHSLYLETRKVPMRDSKGNQYIVGLNIDLTEQRQRDVREHALKNAVPVGIIEFVEGKGAVSANDLACSYFGLTNAEDKLIRLVDLVSAGQPVFPGAKEKFEITANSGAGLDRRLLVISSGWFEMPNSDERASIVSLVDISAMIELRSSLESNSAYLGRVVDQTKESVMNIVSSSSQLNSGAATLSMQTDKQLANLQAMGAAINQLATAVHVTAQNSEAASKLALVASKVAEEGSSISAATAKSITNIAEASKKIVAIVDLVQEIAFQTNILALNAAVEAARAGDAGRGFAVVASEVRTLAQRSAQAVNDVRSHIQGSNSLVSEGVNLSKSMSAKLDEITKANREAAGLVTRIADASREQSDGVQQVDANMQRLGEAAQLNTQLAAQITDITSVVDQSISQLMALVDSRSGNMQGVLPKKSANAA